MIKLASKELKMRKKFINLNKNQRRNLEKSFCHEALKYPPSLSKCSEISSGSKFELVINIERPTESVNDLSKVTATP